MSGIKNPMVSAISASAFPITGLSQATKQALKLFVPSPRTCYSDYSRATRTPLDGSVALMDEYKPNLNSNLILNPLALGAVAGTPGTSPGMNWSIFMSTSGVTRTIVGTGVEVIDGFTSNYIDVKFSGTVTAAGVIGIDPSSLNTAVAKVGDRWCASIYAKKTPGSSGSMPALNMMMPEVSSGLGILNTNALVSMSGITSETTYTRVTASRVFTDNNVAYTGLIIRTPTLAVNTVIDFSIRLAAPMLEKNVSTPSNFNYRTVASSVAAGFQPKLRRGAKNWVLNSGMAGTVTGTLGSGAVVPTGWNIGTVSGVTCSISGTGSETVSGKSLPYIELTYSGTSTSGGDITFDPTSTTAIPAVTGQTWIASTYIKLVSGALPTSGSFMAIVERTSAGAFLQSNAISIYSANSTIQRFSISRNFNQATTAFASMIIRCPTTASGAVNFTIRLYAPQVEFGTTPTTPAISVGSPASNGDGQWWLDFDGTQTKMSLNSIPLTPAANSFLCVGINPNKALMTTGCYPYSESNISNTTPLWNSMYFDGAVNKTIVSVWRNDAGASSFLSNSTGQPGVYSSYFDSTTMRVRYNGVTSGTTGTALATPITINASSIGALFRNGAWEGFYNGAIGSLAVISGVVPSASEITYVEKYIGKTIGTYL